MITSFQANEMIARCERNKKRSTLSSHDHDEMEGYQLCTEVVKTEAGLERCKNYLENGVCPVHSRVVTEQREVGRGSLHEDIEQWLRSLGNKCFYVHSRTDRKTTYEVGNADFIGWFKVTDYMTTGIPFCIEVKQKNKKPTSEQLARLKQAETAGAIAGVAHSLQEFKDLLGCHENH